MSLLCFFLIGVAFREVAPFFQIDFAMVDFTFKKSSFIPVSPTSDEGTSLPAWIENDLSGFNYQSIVNRTDNNIDSVININCSEITLAGNFSSESSIANPKIINFIETKNDSDIAVMIENFENKSLKNISDASSLPSWTYYSRTQFTDHVLDVLQNLNASGYSECGVHVKLHVQEPYSIPSIECHHEREHHNTWCVVLKRIFDNKPLPYNVSIGFLLSDKFDPETSNYYCIGSSSPDGILTMPNMEVIVGRNIPKSREISWENRSTIPVFRGTGWAPATYRLHDCMKPDFNYSEFFREPRFQAVLFSHNYPSLLDAKLSTINWLVQDCFSLNATNGLDKLLPVDYVKNDDYFSSPQVALVLPGIGASFRLSNHMMCGTAAVVQDWPYQEWFTKYLTPFENFIPLARDLSNLNETLHWILNHPDEVKKIASNGRVFWEKYLSFSYNDDHIYELVYRLSEKMHYNVTVAG